MARAEQRARGRALDADIPGLKKHDKLEPWTGLQDIGDEFDQLQPTAAHRVRVCFWRRSEETATRHRSPMLDTGLHTSVNSLTNDILHTSRLGLVENARGDLFQLRVASTEALIQEGIIRLHTSLFLFYRLHHEENPGEGFSTLGDFLDLAFQNAPWSRAGREHHARGWRHLKTCQHSARCTDEHERCRDADGP